MESQKGKLNSLKKKEIIHCQQLSLLMKNIFLLYGQVLNFMNPKRKTVGYFPWMEGWVEKLPLQNYFAIGVNYFSVGWISSFTSWKEQENGAVISLENNKLTYKVICLCKATNILEMAKNIYIFLNNAGSEEKAFKIIVDM